MQSAELEKYLMQKGHVGLWEDNSFSCFCDEPMVKTVSVAPTVDLKTYPISQSGTIDIQEQIRRTQAANTKPAPTVVKTKGLDLGDLDIVDGNMVSNPRSLPPNSRTSHTVGEVTSRQTLTDEDLEAINRTANAAQQRSDSGNLNQYKPGTGNTTTEPTKFGGGWLWLLLLGIGAISITSYSSETKARTVEL